MGLFNRLKRFGITASHDRSGYHDYQMHIGRYYLEHFVQPYTDGKKVIDIGCGEGGVLTAFQEAGYRCTGLEYSEQRAEYAQAHSSNAIQFLTGDIQNFSSHEQYDIILLLDVIEHLEHKRSALNNIKALKAEAGIIIISFPPFRSPFGGHQQVMRSCLKYIPYLQLLPQCCYRWALEQIERDNMASHLHNYKTGITMRDFEKLIHQAGGLRIAKKFLYFVRPRQALRFNLRVRPYRLRILAEYLATGVVYILK